MSLFDYAVITSGIAAFGLLMAAWLVIREAILWLIAWEAVRFFLRYEMSGCAVEAKVRDGQG